MKFHNFQNLPNSVQPFSSSPVKRFPHLHHFPAGKHKTWRFSNPRQGTFMARGAVNELCLVAPAGVGISVSAPSLHESTSWGNSATREMHACPFLLNDLFNVPTNFLCFQSSYPVIPPKESGPCGEKVYTFIPANSINGSTFNSPWAETDMSSFHDKRSRYDERR